ncbi:hypothetical protein THRCLA_20935 [Thraustotheca clavata]|uniref:Myb-like domain-containing protein n=1 Tax=Thraustotheca clavata TaxID=74557 RepID=A0A1W0A1U0_9STRA|nr:hypothetical protein THRCLA_20935 [Thraustotheca clavata]
MAGKPKKTGAAVEKKAEAPAGVEKKSKGKKAKKDEKPKESEKKSEETTKTPSKSGKFGQSWSKKEDKKLIAAVKAQGKGYKANWKLVAQSVSGRTAGACQGRWNTELDPLVDRTPWTEELDAKLLELYKDPEYDSWSKRALALALGKTSANGEPMRRSGADVCSRYFKLTKGKKKSKQEEQKKTTEVAWDDDTEAPEADLSAIVVPAAAKLTRNQANRLRRNERKRKHAALAAEAKKEAAENEANEEEEQEAPKKKPKFKDVAGKRHMKKGKPKKKSH